MAGDAPVNAKAAGLSGNQRAGSLVVNAKGDSPSENQLAGSPVVKSGRGGLPTSSLQVGF
jgi:hypothetical protein